MLRITLAHVEHLEEAIAALDDEIDGVMVPFSRARDHLDTITGVGKRAAECIIAESLGGSASARLRSQSGIPSW